MTHPNPDPVPPTPGPGGPGPLTARAHTAARTGTAAADPRDRYPHRPRCLIRFHSRPDPTRNRTPSHSLAPCP